MNSFSPEISVSHIAWPPELEQEAITMLRAEGVFTIEVAPMRAFGNPLNACEAEVAEKAAWYREQGMVIGSFQALLFGSEGLELFGDDSCRARMKEFLMAVGRVAGWAGAGPLVFGSPKNRLKGDLSREEAHRRATGFFREIGDACAASGSCLVIEANPPAYAADFCTTLEEAASLVTSVDSPGFGLHVDAGGMALGDELFEPILRDAIAMVRHVHASQPNLVSFESPDPIHQRLATVLRETGYQGSIAIEMRAQSSGLEAVRLALESVRGIYGNMGC